MLGMHTITQGTSAGKVKSQSTLLMKLTVPHEAQMPTRYALCHLAAEYCWCLVCHGLHVPNSLCTAYQPDMSRNWHPPFHLTTMVTTTHEHRKFHCVMQNCHRQDGGQSNTT